MYIKDIYKTTYTIPEQIILTNKYRDSINYEALYKKASAMKGNVTVALRWNGNSGT